MYKNQYIITDKNITPPSDSNSFKIGKFSLYTSKEIPISISNNKKIILLGYTFHCYNQSSEKKIVNKLSQLENEEFLEEIDFLCGHYILFRHKQQINIYTDASSSFKVFYGESNKNTFIGSDPRILNKYSNFILQTSKEEKIFYESDYFLKNKIKIGHHTRYKDMYQLISNHKLLIENLTSERIFPREKRLEISMQNAKDKLVPIFENILTKIEKKYTIFSSITAGYDSRLLMSATKKISHKIQYYTFQLPEKSKNFIDYTLPKSICSNLQLKYITIKISELDSNTKNEIENIYDLPKEKPFQQYKDIFPENEKPNILLVGFVSEIAKNYLERVKIRNGKDMVRANHYPDNKYLEKYYQKWLDKNKKIIGNLGYETLDFLHWEQDITNFAGQNTYYAHHYVNLFSIFNSREIIKIMLSVGINHRDGKNTEFFRYLINSMWPELLNYPFNPTKKDKIILFMKKIKIYAFYKYLQIKLRKYGEIK
ncbi:hypothetical protein N9T80_00260 [bacterium]|nr:hypothetical protein [bacterium]